MMEKAVRLSRTYGSIRELYRAISVIYRTIGGAIKRRTRCNNVYCIHGSYGAALVLLGTIIESNKKRSGH